MAPLKWPAGRIGDPVTHDLVVPCGMIGPPAGGVAVTVVIEGQAAAFSGCTVMCTGLTAAGPAHPPAPAVVVGGSSTVLIHGAPAARWAPPDATTCGAALGDMKLVMGRTVEIG